MAGRRGLSDSGLRRLVRVMAEEVGQAQDYPLRRLMEEYLEAQSVEVAPEHSKQTRNRLDTLITWVEDRCNADGRQLVYCGDLDPVDVNAFIKHRLKAGLSNSTVRQTVSSLKTALRWGREASKRAVRSEEGSLNATDELPRYSAEGLVPGTRVVLRSRADLVYLRAVLDSAEEILDGGPLEIEGGGDGE